MLLQSGQINFITSKGFWPITGNFVVSIEYASKPLLQLLHFGIRNKVLGKTKLMMNSLLFSSAKNF